MATVQENAMCALWFHESKSVVTVQRHFYLEYSKRRDPSNNLRTREEVDKGVKKMDIALKFDIPPNSLSTIIKNRGKLQNYDSSNSCSKRLRTCVYEDVDVAVLKWIHTMRDKNVPISGPFIIERALQFAKALGYDQFLGSNGWLEKFKKRRGIVAKVQSGEISPKLDSLSAVRVRRVRRTKRYFLRRNEKNMDIAKGKTRNYGFCAA
ncbi:tigger transposable element-derived protein 4 [Nephila pilipes]|uniref:Tigger transposable element-derived protein 4 n=1 Tax=Nephila pilipes TaxID=299642 RepID=A0A8X6KJS3_NEPPI|nr:tigger transposable element-derived protein 4 [Nephila pilipes]